jgi:L-ascorbate metabolism protein UlaG (beta-lactamase superfamily)
MDTPDDHFDGERFFNPSGAGAQPLSAVPQMLVEPRRPWPAHIDTPLRQPAPLNGAAAVVTFIGHSSFLIQTAEGNILTDPMYSERASPLSFVGPKRVRPAAVPFDDLPRISTVLLSHNHYDHCDRWTLSQLARRFDPLVVTPLKNGPLLRSFGVRKVEELDWWQASRAAAFPIALTPAHHFSARTPFDRNRALWGGFVFEVGGRRLYFAGDSAYAPFFSEIPQRLGAIDLALLPIGAYEPRWFMQSVHMNPAEAVQVHLDVAASASIGMHFGTFRLTSEGIDEPLMALDDACRARQVLPSSFRTLDFGESTRLERP